MEVLHLEGALVEHFLEESAQLCKALVSQLRREDVYFFTLLIWVTDR